MSRSIKFGKSFLPIVSATLSVAFIATSGAVAAQTIQHSSGQCLRVQNNSASPSNGTGVVLSSNCSGPASRFTWTPGGSIRHVPSNMCIHPGGINNPPNGTPLVLWQGCDFADRVRFDQTSGNSLQHVSGQRCVHPNGGLANPREGTTLVMFNGCNEQRLAFGINGLPVASNNPPSNNPPPSNQPPVQQPPQQPPAQQPPQQNGITTVTQLQNAIDNANAGDVIRLASGFSYQTEVLVTKPVVIDGGGNTLNHRVPTSGAFAQFTPAFAILANNVTLRNMTIRGDNRNGANTLVQLNNRGTTRANNFTLRNVTLRDATAGLRNQGIIPSGLFVENNTFINMNKAIDLTRDANLSEFNRQRTDFFDGAGDRIFYQTAGRLRITGNSFFVEQGQLPMQVGIQIDAGNDGFNPDPAPGFPNNTRASRGDNDNLVTAFTSGVIANNRGRFNGTPVEASEFAIALAKVASVIIRDNFVGTAGSSSDPFDFSAGINVEHLSHNIIVRDNSIEVNRVVNAQQNNQAITVLPYQDHGNSANSEHATFNVRIINNDFFGQGRTGIFAFAFRDLEIDGNNFNQFSLSRTGSSTLALFNADDNGNGRLDNNERSNLVGDFDNFNATSNLGGDGRVEATIFNTADPSDLPPNLR